MSSLRTNAGRFLLKSNDVGLFSLTRLVLEMVPKFLVPNSHMCWLHIAPPPSFLPSQVDSSKLPRWGGFGEVVLQPAFILIPPSSVPLYLLCPTCFPNLLDGKDPGAARIHIHQKPTQPGWPPNLPVLVKTKGLALPLCLEALSKKRGSPQKPLHHHGALGEALAALWEDTRAHCCLCPLPTAGKLGAGEGGVKCSVCACACVGVAERTV